jgi:hypothetical protein
MIINHPYDYLNTREKIEFYLNQKLKPTFPSSTKPKQPSNATSQEIFEYAKVLKKWETENDIIEAEWKEINDFNNSIDNFVDILIQEESGLNALNIPDWQKSKISYLAYENGHAYGHHSVYNHLIELVNLFEEN